MSGDRLLRQLDVDIENAEGWLRLWRKQQKSQDDSPAAAMVDALVDGYEVHLKHLRAIRAGIEVA